VQALARRLAETSAAGRPWPSDPVPLALVITELDVGGAEKALVALATGLDRRRWHPTVVALGPEGALAAPLRAEGVTVECLGVDPRRPLRAVLRLAGVLRRLRPAVVQSFLFHANVAARLAVPLAGRPAPWVVGGLRVAERRKPWHVALDRMTARLATGSVCVSEGVRRFSREAGGWPDERLTVIPNAVAVAPIDRAAAAALPRSALGLEDVAEGAFLSLFVGRLDSQKGLPVLLEAAERAVVARPDHDWHFALAGGGPERDRLTADAASRPALAGRVHWLGLRGDVPALMHACDLLVLPSLWEGMPNVVLEAMTARRAVVATRVEGTEDLVTPGRTGWLVTPGDSDALAAALLEAAADPDRRSRYGQAGRARVEADFTPEQSVRAYERLWAGLLGYG
jgi:glycosyltransferase involved in cell wall biosynthesis